MISREIVPRELNGLKNVKVSPGMSIGHMYFIQPHNPKVIWLRPGFWRMTGQSFVLIKKITLEK